MKPFWRRLVAPIVHVYGGIPLSLRVALLVSPVILLGQFLTAAMLWEARSVTLLHTGIDFGPPHATPQFMPPPGFPQHHDDRFDTAFGNNSTLSRFERLSLGPSDFIPPWELLTSTFLITALIVWVAAWWVTRPLARLSRAAETLGRDVDSEPLDERGPPEVQRAAMAFNRMQDRLLRFLRGRSDALLAMSHDLKTPITRLQLRAALLPEHLQGPIGDDISVLQKRVEEALGFMHGVHNTEPMQDVDLNALVATVVEQLQDTGADVSIDGRARALRCRPSQLGRALSNVLENAVRYGGCARLAVADKPEALTLRVTDEGPGVPEALLARLTEPFFRVENSRNRDSGGTGLGLAITKDLIESMGGRLLLRNQKPGGLEVTMVLPRQST